MPRRDPALEDAIREIAAPVNIASPLKIHAPGSTLTDRRQAYRGGELILSSGASYGARVANVGPADTPLAGPASLKSKPPPAPPSARACRTPNLRTHSHPDARGAWQMLP